MDSDKITAATGDGDSVIRLVKWPKVFLFGDSLTQRSFDPDSGLWGALLANKLQRIGDVVNRGFAGYNSKFCRVILPQIVSTSNSSDISAFVIFLGANDSCAQENVPKDCQYVSLEDYKDNLESMINYLQGIGIDNEKVILISPPPYSDEKWTNFCTEIGRDLPKGERLTSDYASTCIDLAKNRQIEYVDLYGAMIKEEDWSIYLYDGLHLNPKGGQFLFDLLWPVIEKKVGDKMIFPYWREFDETYKI